MSASIRNEAILGASPYPKNQWYVAAYSHEVTQKPFRRTICGEPISFFRTSAGEPVALLDQCPHRGMPLSMGTVLGDTIQCKYHGIEFSSAGRCTKIPSGGGISPKMCVRSFPIAEVWEWIWVWTGDPELADPSTIPSHEPFGLAASGPLPGWYAKPGPLLSVKANYLLPFENLLDASHISFLHDGKIDSGEVAFKEPEVAQEGGRIRVARKMLNERQSPLVMKTFGLEGDCAHRTIIAEAQPPNVCGIRIELAQIDSDEQSTALGVNQLVVGITPETDTTCFEFTAVAQTFPFMLETWFEDLRQLLSEDVVAMDAIQATFDQLGPDRRTEVSVRADAGAMKARRLIARMLAAEQG